MDSDSYLGKLSEQFREQFVSGKSVLSFEQYLELFAERPGHLGRNAAEYLKDTIDHFGREKISSPTGAKSRFVLFDAPFDEGREKLIGQEEVQLEFYNLLSNFVREGMSNKLILLHGPNGSAKTSFVQCLARAMVNYSKTAEGATYTFAWVFPKSSFQGKRVGFESAASPPAEDPGTFAFHPQDEIAALVPSQMSDHPIFLIPKAERRQFLDDVSAGEGRKFSSHLLNGDLSPDSRQIFDALLAAYGGDLRRVLAHVQVRRFHFSRRYRRGIVTIEPQMHVDATMRQITMDESFSNLPPGLRHVSMFELSGDLVEANRGLLEFSDLLKRPVDAFKYLLGSCENNRIAVGGVIAYLDIVFVGTTNDKYVHAFTKVPEFPSFKGRTELVKVPYIRDYGVERRIYDMQVTPEVVGRHIAPHAREVASLWAVLTRLKKPAADRYPETIREAIGKLTPLEKADLYARGTHPLELKPEEAKELVQSIGELYRESEDDPDYEGWIGASPREVKGVLLAAAQATDMDCLHPVKVFEEIGELLKMKSVYEFLQISSSGEFHDAGLLLKKVKDRYSDLVDREFTEAMGLVTEGEFARLLQKYATHASAYLKKQTVIDPVSKAEIPPDEKFLTDTEAKWKGSGDKDRVRQEFMGRIASFSLENPGVPPDYQFLFANQFERLKTAYYEENKGEIDRSMELVLNHLDGVPLQEAEKRTASEIIKNMIDRYGYCDGCIGPAVSFLADGRKDS